MKCKKFLKTKFRPLLCLNLISIPLVMKCWRSSSYWKLKEEIIHATWTICRTIQTVKTKMLMTQPTCPVMPVIRTFFDWGVVPSISRCFCRLRVEEMYRGHFLYTCEVTVRVIADQHQYLSRLPSPTAYICTRRIGNACVALPRVVAFH